MKNTYLTIAGFLLLTAFTACNSTSEPELEVQDPNEMNVVSNGSVIGRDADGLYSEEANAIIIGTVESMGMDGGQPYTDATITIEEVLKGDENLSTVSVEVRNPLSSLWVEDSASLFIGERVLLFLGTDANGDYVIFAGELGKYTIDENEEVTSIAEFKMPLADVKAKIEARL
ncbi:MAG: hypothetical protein AAB383_05025 [Patescibacteria group bacterium]